jgi:hypothetical protein
MVWESAASRGDVRKAGRSLADQIDECPGEDKTCLVDVGRRPVKLGGGRVFRAPHGCTRFYPPGTVGLFLPEVEFASWIRYPWRYRASGAAGELATGVTAGRLSSHAAGEPSGRPDLLAQARPVHPRRRCIRFVDVQIQRKSSLLLCPAQRRTSGRTASPNSINDAGIGSGIASK